MLEFRSNESKNPRPKMAQTAHFSRIQLVGMLAIYFLLLLYGYLDNLTSGTNTISTQAELRSFTCGGPSVRRGVVLTR